MKFVDLSGLSRFKKKIIDALQNWVAKQGYETKTNAQNTYQPKGNYLTQHQDLSGITGQLNTMQDTLTAIKNKLDGYPTMVKGDGVTYAFIDGQLVKIAEKTEDVATVNKS